MQPFTSGAPSTPNERLLFIETPVGPLEIKGDAEFISGINFREEMGISAEDAPPLLLECRRQLEEYFAGTRLDFELPIHQPGTTFQQSVWLQLCGIPYASTISYQQLANRVESPSATRAVGATNGRNQIAIVVPCHRVIGSNGKLTGYAGGLWRKKWLLEHEYRIRRGTQTLF
ncbi:methylated-DNA--[protein]-cysteine S-methyltransferase [Chitinophaga sedimenti]|uniref:methylated-DNA--[protein]-cysteine S-methyltransferase n=1 Tax=Chitinophaga sedimenti TaxID=2033606 RepID=UPI002003B587|nr:methylated-DNA--[protein]-cysteine S-methyltransferase [Chitinophaga sedimenti]MCK7556390.1 methylated-DNA--[protein]-cysteine S-methyltransferase [Chitinophaga sedimenti]